MCVSFAVTISRWDPKVLWGSVIRQATNADMKADHRTRCRKALAPCDTQLVQPVRKKRTPASR